MFKYTTAIRKIRQMKARKKVIQGGTSAGKTFGILPVLIHKAIKEPGLEISIVSETVPHLRRGALKDFLKIMHSTHRYISSHYNKSLLKYTFSNGSYIEFFSADMEDRLRGARRDILYINEANNVDFESYHQLAIRTRLDIYLDFNPTSEFWAHTEVLTEPDSELLVLTYKDNEALPENVLEVIETALEKSKTSDYWKNWVDVYVYGQIGSLQGVVFSDWKQVDEIPQGAELLGYGIDFGFSDSPFALVAVYEFERSYYFDEKVYSTGLTNHAAAKIILDREDIDEDALFIADSAEPKSIAEIEEKGINIIACDSKTDIRPYAIQKLQDKTFYVTKSSSNMIDNLRHYVWATDKTGKSLNKPKKEHDHTMDAIIYFIGTEDKYTGVYNISRI